MKSLGTLVTALGLAAVLAVPASAADLSGKKGLGMTGTIGGPHALLVDFAFGSTMFGELNLGATFNSPDDSDADVANPIMLGLGAHFQVLYAGDAAVTAGLRLNLGFSSDTNPDGGEFESVTQIGVDVPVRVYWWASENFSLHGETGIRYHMNPEFGSVFGISAAGAKGSTIGLFDAMAGMGMTFWW